MSDSNTLSLEQRAIAAMQGGRVEEAAQLWQQLADQGSVSARANLASCLRRLGRLQEARTQLEQALAAQPEMADAWTNCGFLLRQLKEPQKAEEAFRRALALQPALRPARLELALLLRDHDRRDEAIAEFRELLQDAPGKDDDAAARAAAVLALLLQRDGQLAEAAALYRRALARRPDAGTHADYGVLLQEQGDGDGAVQQWQQALALDPRHRTALMNLGILQRLRKQYDPAIATLRRALQQHPDDADLSSNLALTLLECGRVTEAEALAKESVARHPQHADSHLILGFAHAHQAEAELAVTDFARAADRCGNAPPAISNILFSSLYSDRRDAAAKTALHRDMAGRLRACEFEKPSAARPRGSALRVGFLSPDMRQHPVAMFFEPVLQHLDRSRIESICYSTTQARDAFTQRLRQHAAHWRDLAGQRAGAVAACIAADGCDVLVDLAGHTAGGLPTVLRARPAPVQAGYIGYPYTLGLPEMDWLIADERLVPAQDEPLYLERIARLPGCFSCYRPPQDLPEPARAAGGGVTFGSFNNLPKISNTTVDLWVRLLRAVPDSRLLLRSLAFADAEIRALTAQRFIRRGIAAQRLQLEPPVRGLNEALLAYSQVDVALDPLPYNGFTTTCDALWMGVPVVSCPGQGMYSRAGAAFLHAAGVPQWLARDHDHYVEIAAALAGDAALRARLRGSLREQLRQSPVCDAPRAASELSAALERMAGRV